MSEVIWRCKIGGSGELIGGGQDLPMRDAVAARYREIVGVVPEFIFSGWGAELDECERAVVEDREPREHECTRPGAARDPLLVRLKALRDHLRQDDPLPDWPPEKWIATLAIKLGQASLTALGPDGEGLEAREDRVALMSRREVACEQLLAVAAAALDAVEALEA